MSERWANDGQPLSAGELLSLHADHRRGLHTTKVADCTQCLLDELSGRFAHEGDTDAPPAA